MKTRRELLQVALLVSGSAVFGSEQGWEGLAPQGHPTFARKMHQLEKASGGSGWIAIESY